MDSETLAMGCLQPLGGRPGDTDPAGAISVSEKLVTARRYGPLNGHVSLKITD